MIGYVGKFESNTTVSFKINGSKLLQKKKYSQIWRKKLKICQKKVLIVNLFMVIKINT